MAIINPMYKAIIFRITFNLILAMSITSGLFCQVNREDSFRKVIDQAGNNAGKVRQLLAFSEYLANNDANNHSRLELLSEAEAMASKMAYPYGQGKAYLLKGDYYFNNSEWEKSIQSYESTIQFAHLVKNIKQSNELLFGGLLNLAEVYNYNGDYVTALEHRLKALALVDSVAADASNKTKAYVSIANDFRHLNQRSKAIEYLEKAKPYLNDAADNFKLDYYYEYYQNLLLNGQLEESQAILATVDSGVIHYNLTDLQKIEFAGMAHKLHGMFQLNYNNNYEAAVDHFREYLNSSRQQNNQTHIAIALNKMGIAYDSLKQYREAITVFRESYEICVKEKIIDYGYKSAFELSTIYQKLGDFKNAYSYSEYAYNLKDTLSSTEKLRELNFLEAKYQSTRKEKEIARLEVSKALQKQTLLNTRFIIAMLVLVGMVILFFVYRYYHQKQLKEIEIRNKISQDLHDDIGATLSSINIYGELANKIIKDKPDHSKEMLSKISEQSKGLMARMSDVIWSMKPVEEEKNSFANRLKNYSSELLAPKEISCQFDIDESIGNKILNPITRKNMLLIVKEAMNNIAKYSSAQNANVSLLQEGKNIILSISDNGRGFSKPDTLNGNGLGNMQQRSKDLGGVCKISSEPEKGVCIICTFPITIFSNKG